MLVRWSLVLGLALAVVNCGSSDKGSGDVDVTGDGQTITDGTSEVSGDVSVDIKDDHATADVVSDSMTEVQDGMGEVADTVVGPTPLPVEPPALSPDKVLSDGAFVQEFNHTWNEMEPEVGELVALVEPPLTYQDWDNPTLVAPNGLLLRDDSGVLAAAALPDGDPGPLVAAASNQNGVYVATKTEIYRVASDGTHTLVGSLPEGSELVRLTAETERLHVLASNYWGVVGLDSMAKVEQTLVPAAIARVANGYYVATSEALVGLAGTELSSLSVVWTVPLNVGTPVAVLLDRKLPQELALVVVGSQGLAGFTMELAQDPVPAEVPLFAQGRVPLANAVAAVPMGDGGFAVAAQGGVYRTSRKEGLDEYRVYVADRWMPAGDVRDVLAPTYAQGPLYFATSGGLGYVTRESWTVKQKMDPMVERIVLRHDRDGAVADSRLMVPGDLSTNIPWDSDNDGGWSCYWVVGECMRYKVTGDPAAKAHFDKSLDRMLSLRTLTGTEYFLARAVIRIDGCLLDDCDDPDDGEWYKSPDEEWWVKANTSNDEVTSHMFMMGMAYDLCADEAQKQAIVAHIDGIVGGLVDNGYRLVDPQDGEPTSYGQFDPQYVNWWVEGKWGDGARRSAQILAALNLAHYLTGKQKYLDAKAFLMDEHQYDDNVDHVGDATLYPFCAGSGDCDELGAQAFYVLIRYEPDPVLRARWLAAWNKLYGSLRTQQDALWDLSHAFMGGPDVDLSRVMRWFQNYPTDLIRFIMHGQGRQDTVPAPAYYLTKDKNAAFVMRSDGLIFPGDERPNDRHNTNQFVLNGGWGPNVEMDSADVLFAYWMGRYYGFIKE